MFDPPKPPSCPTLKDRSTLEGWDEFHKWALRNDPTWSCVFTAIQRGLIDETTGLRYLAAEMLSLALKWRGLALDMQARTVPPIIVIPDSWTYYKGYGGDCEGYFWRVSPEGKVQGIHEDAESWHQVTLSWEDTAVDAREVSADKVPPRLLTAPVKP